MKGKAISHYVDSYNNFEYNNQPLSWLVSNEI